MGSGLYHIRKRASCCGDVSMILRIFVLDICLHLGRIARTCPRLFSSLAKESRLASVRARIVLVSFISGLIATACVTVRDFNADVVVIRFRASFELNCPEQQVFVRWLSEDSAAVV